MPVEQDIINWEHLHEVTELTPERIAPPSVINDYISRNISLSTDTPIHDKKGVEIGFGLGRNIMYLLENNYCQYFVGIDQTESALNKGKLHAEIRGFKDRCDFVRAIAGNVFTYKDASFDFALDVMAASVFISHVDARKMYAKEIYRILKPGGIFFIFTGNADGEFYKTTDLPKGSEPGTFYRNIDGALEKAYTKQEIIALFSPLEPIILEPQSHYLRAFSEQELQRSAGFWFAVFKKRTN